MLKGSDDNEGEPRGFSRRTFLVTGAAAGGGLLVGVYLPDQFGAMAQVVEETLAPNAFVRIGQMTALLSSCRRSRWARAPTRRCPCSSPRSSKLISSKVGLEAAPPNDKLYANPLLGFQVTGGSTSVPGFWEPLRRAGATARVMLIEAAAAQWNVDAASCRAEKGEVVSPTGQRMNYGALVEAASKLPVPDKVMLKDAEEFHANRNARQAARHAREGERQGQVRHRRDGAGNEVRDGRRMPGVRWQGQECGRQQDPGNRGRAASGAHR